MKLLGMEVLSRVKCGPSSLQSLRLCHLDKVRRVESHLSPGVVVPDVKRIAQRIGCRGANFLWCRRRHHHSKLSGWHAFDSCRRYSRNGNEGRALSLTKSEGAGWDKLSGLQGEA